MNFKAGVAKERERERGGERRAYRKREEVRDREGERERVRSSLVQL